jgi:hypothetical protein
MDRARIQSRAESRDRCAPETVSAGRGASSPGPASYQGNQAALRRLSRTLSSLQRSTTVGATNDPLEAEADQVADRVMRMPDPEASASSSRPDGGAGMAQPRRVGNGEGNKIYRKTEGVATGERPAPASVNQALRSPGSPLDASTRGFFEPRLGVDLERIRIHDDPAAGRAAQSIYASAFTSGDHIVFAPGQFNPAGGAGRRMLAHELAHTMQPETGVIRRAPGPGSDAYMRGYEDGKNGVASTPGPLNEEGMADYDDGYAKGSYERDQAAPAPKHAAAGITGSASAAQPSVWDQTMTELRERGAKVRQNEAAAIAEIDALEDKNKASRQRALDEIAHVPVLGSLARASNAFNDVSDGIVGGVVKGATGLLGGVAGIAVDPVDSYIGMEGLAEHVPLPFLPGAPNPIHVAHALYNVAENGADPGEEAKRTLDPIETAKGDAEAFGKVGLGLAKPFIDEYKKGKIADAVGLGIFNAVLLATGAEEAEAPSVVGEVGETLGATEGAVDATAEGSPALGGAPTAGESTTVPVHPSVDPLGPTQYPPGPTELPPAPLKDPLLPDKTWDPVIPQSPRVPSKIDPPTYPPLEPTQVPVHPNADPLAPTQYPAAPTEYPHPPIDEPLLPGKSWKAGAPKPPKALDEVGAANSAGAKGQLEAVTANAPEAEVSVSSEAPQADQSLSPVKDETLAPAAQSDSELQTVAADQNQSFSSASNSSESSFEGVIDRSEYENHPAIVDRLSRARALDIGGYKSLTGKGEYGRVGDGLDSDEALQNAYIREKKGVSRVSEATKDNPAMALTPELHRQIKNLKTADMAGLTPEQVLQHHLQQMKSFVPDFILSALEREGMRYIKGMF